jgi:hypothetical protein
MSAARFSHLAASMSERRKANCRPARSEKPRRDFNKDCSGKVLPLPLMPRIQKTLRLLPAPIPGETFNEYRFRKGELQRHVANGNGNGQTPTPKLFADLLKRKCREVMADVTKCQVDSLPAQLARLDDLADIIEHAINYDYKETAENKLSGRQLLYPSTLADFLACLELTRKNHRCPEFVDTAHDLHKEIIHKLDTIAFFVSQNSTFNTVKI